MAEIKSKTIFDILNDLSFNKVEWENQEQKKVQTWMLNRWLSMHPDYLEIVAECQPMTDNLSPEMYYKFYLDLLPKKKFFTKYISKKAEKEDSYERLTNFISNCLNCSLAEADQNLQILLQYHLEELKEYLKKYGHDDKTIKREFGI